MNASAVNNIVFRSVTGAAASVNLKYTPTGYADNYTVHLSGADHITFENMTISTGSNGAYTSRVVWIDGGSHFNTFDSLLVVGDPNTYSTWSSEAALFGSEMAVDSNNTFSNNVMSDGSMG